MISFLIYFIVKVSIRVCWLQVIDFEVPITVQLTVVDVDPGVRGNTVQGNVP